MNSNWKPLLTATVLLVTAGPALADADSPQIATTSSVAEMLQRRQENQLREQLTREGRWAEVRQMDEEKLRRQQVLAKQTLTRINAELAREGTVETQVNGDGVSSFCPPVRVPTRLEALKTKHDQSAGGVDTSNVR
jgi:hypothetical protein